MCTTYDATPRRRAQVQAPFDGGIFKTGTVARASRDQIGNFQDESRDELMRSKLLIFRVTKVIEAVIARTLRAHQV
jgi:hypothetical protein